MSARVGLSISEPALRYDHGEGHPLRPDRVGLTWRLIEAVGLDRLDHVERLTSDPADDGTLMLVHTPEFVDATRRAGHGEGGSWARFGYGQGDNPIFEGMHEAASFVVGSTVRAASAVWRSEHEHAFAVAGGLHHAMPGRASGFCVYDDPAIAIAWLLAEGAHRVAYVDIDVHHGDGPQAIFYEDPRVLTVSIHELAPWFFPGTGEAAERGGPGAEGSAVNVPLPPGTGDAGWLDAFEAVVPPAVKAFRPQVLVTQLGCDTHHTDPLAQLRLTTAAYRRTARALHELAHEAAGGRWIATGGGGYEWARVAPRAWTLAFAAMCGADLPDDLPAEWLAEAERRVGGSVPSTFSEAALAPGPADDEARVVASRVAAAVEAGA